MKAREKSIFSQFRTFLTIPYFASYVYLNLCIFEIKIWYTGFIFLPFIFPFDLFLEMLLEI